MIALPFVIFMVLCDFLLLFGLNSVIFHDFCDFCASFLCVFSVIFVILCDFLDFCEIFAFLQPL